MNIRQFIPRPMKLSYQHLKRGWRDKQMNYQFAQPQIFVEDLKYQIETTHIIRPSYLYLNKIHNLHLACGKMEKFQIKPGEIFSFWKILGEPNAKNGYKKGRNIINNQLTEDYGGGLCQLSSILYHLSLLGNLEIVERYNHSIDIYTDETRYSPLGSDATVAFGYRDLRIRNNSDGVIQFKFEVTTEKITAILTSENPINKTDLKFEVVEKNGLKNVVGFNDDGQIISQSVYKSLDKNIS